MLKAWVALSTWKASITGERGVTMVEYGIILGLVAIAAVTTIGLVGGKIADAWNAANNANWP